MLIIANWKAYVEDSARAKSLLALSKRLSRSTNNTLIIAPPAPFLATLSLGNTSTVAFAAQDVSASTGGAATGEVTARAYRAAGATYALIGHSERRAGGDTDATVAQKLSHALAQGLTPILCIGEHERDSEGRYLSVVREQLSSAYTNLTAGERKRVLVAYEPVWAIGKTAQAAIGASDLSEMILYIRKVLSDFLPGKTSARTPILYGGSVEAGNAKTLAASTGIDGFLIGHASVDADSFATLVTQLS